MRVSVVGAGAWGLPAAAELARRGHRVDLLDMHGAGNRLGSSSGPTRLWRLSHPDPVRVRLAARSVRAWQRLERDTGRTLLLRRGLLWRDPWSNDDVAGALAAESVDFERVHPADVARFLPGLRPNGVDAVWQADAGPVLSEIALRLQLDRFEAAGGSVRTGDRLVGVHPSESNVTLTMAQGPARKSDVVVLAPGPWAPGLLAGLGVDLPLRPVLQQVTYFQGTPGWEYLPCWYEGEHDGHPALYGMPTPSLGYKVGIDRAVRRLEPDDADRSPDPGTEAEITTRVAADLHSVHPVPLASQVCSWTESPDGRPVLDRLHAGRVVLACGDSGEGFKFSALMGEILADLVDGRTPDEDVASLGLDRFGGAAPPQRPALGR